MPRLNDAAEEMLQLTKAYTKKSLSHSLLQLASTLACLIMSFILSAAMLHYSIILSMLFTVITACFILRSFILLHDCSHSAYFKSRVANYFVGFILGVITLTPFLCWKKHHIKHHATSGNLEKRGFGDIKTLTLKEYFGLTPFKRLLYRLYRNPLILFIIGPIFFFLICQRFAYFLPKKWVKERRSVYLTNIALAGLIYLIWRLFGWQTLCFIYLPSMALAASMGVWLFYIQHQFEEAYWQPQKNWHRIEAAIYGSTYYDLPKSLHWLSANIGYHHIHHLNPNIPNYSLSKCFKHHPKLREAKTIHFLRSFSCAKFKLWDERQGKMISFKDIDNKELERC